jgi:hypothetical protein
VAALVRRSYRLIARSGSAPPSPERRRSVATADRPP